MFQFPSGYEDDGIEGDKIWDELMPRKFSQLSENESWELLMKCYSWFGISAYPTPEEV
jgi:hypothetical protein